MLDPHDKEEIVAAVQAGIELHVNGKIRDVARDVQNLSRRVDEKFEEQAKNMKSQADEIKPYIQAASGARFMFKTFLFAGSLAFAWMSIRNAFFTTFPTSLDSPK